MQFHGGSSHSVPSSMCLRMGEQEWHAEMGKSDTKRSAINYANQLVDIGARESMYREMLLDIFIPTRLESYCSITKRDIN